MPIRDYNFLTGPTTATLPSSTTPTASDDLITKSYAESNFVAKGTAIVTTSLSIGSGDPANSSSVLDCGSTTKGALLPRMTTAQRNAIGTPAEGLLVFDLDLNQLFVYTGSEWVAVGSILGSTTASHASAAFNVSSSTKGLLIPRVTTTERDNISSPATGLLVYNITTSKVNQYNGSAWSVVDGGSLNGPGSSTDNAILRFDGTGGATAQNSGVTIDDSNNVAGAASYDATSASATAALLTLAKTSATAYAGDYDAFVSLSAAGAAADSCWIKLIGSGNINVMGNAKSTNNWQLIMNVTGTPLKALDIDNQGVINVGTTAVASAGIKFNNNTASYSPTLFNHFEQTTVSLTFTQASGYSQAVTAKLVRIGGYVHVEIPAFNATATATAPITVAAGTIPARFRPGIQSRHVAMIIVGGAVSTSPGMIVFETDGGIALYSSFTGANFGSGSLAGLAGSSSTMSFGYRI